MISGGQVDLMSIHTMSEVDEADDEDDDDLSSGRQSRIEELARKIMEEKTQLAELEKNEKRVTQQLSRDPIDLNAELDTVSERSEIEDDESIRLANHSGKILLIPPKNKTQRIEILDHEDENDQSDIQIDTKLSK